MSKPSFPTTVTSSLDVEACDYKWAMSRVFNLRQAPSFHRDLNFGAAIAEALFKARHAYYIEKLSKKEAETMAFDYLDTDFSVEFYAYEEALKKANKPPEKIKTPERMKNLLTLYFNRFPFDKEVKIPFLFNSTFSGEQVFNIPLLENGTNLAVKPDLIAVAADHSHTVLIDEKTATKKWNSEAFEYLYQMRTQFNLYVWALNFLQHKGFLNVPEITEFEVRRLVLDASPASFHDSVFPVNIPLEVTRVEECFSNFKSKMLARFENFQKLEALEVENSSYFVNRKKEAAKIFPRNFDNCEAYGRPCPLIEHCAAGRSTEFLGFKDSIIDTNTKEVKFI